MGQFLVKVLVVCGLVLVLSCGLGQRRERAYDSDDLAVFLEGYRRAVVADDRTLILEAYIDPLYRREQLEEMLGGDQRQFFDELYGIGKHRFADIVAMELGESDAVTFEPSGAGPCPGALGGQCPVVLTYENGVQIEDIIYLIRYPEGDRTFGVEGPRG